MVGKEPVPELASLRKFMSPARTGQRDQWPQVNPPWPQPPPPPPEKVGKGEPEPRDPVMTPTDVKLLSTSSEPQLGQDRPSPSEYSDMDIFSSKERPHF